MFKHISQFFQKPAVKAFFRVFILLVIIHSVLSLPTPYIYRAPGECSNLTKMITVTGVPKRNFHGRFYMTSVYNEPANGYLLLVGSLNRGTAFIPKNSLTDEPSNRQQIEHMTQDMEMSKLMASVAAFRALGYPVKVERTPLTIRVITPWSKAMGILQRGDEITQVEGEKPKGPDDLRMIIRRNRKKQTIMMSIVRDGKKMDLSVPLMERNGRPMIGIISDNPIKATNLPDMVKIDSTSVIGSSAGLMFTLEIMRQLSGIDLTGGNMIAGTGAIDDDGKVYPVDGVDMKVKCAEKTGARYFLVPKENYGDAKGGAIGNIRIIPVNNLNDALKALKEINSTATLDNFKPSIIIPKEMKPVRF